MKVGQRSLQGPYQLRRPSLWFFAVWGEGKGRAWLVVQRQMISFNLHDGLITLLLLRTPIYRWENWGWERFAYSGTPSRRWRWNLNWGSLAPGLCSSSPLPGLSVKSTKIRPYFLTSFLILLHCFFTYKHHPGSSCIAGHDAENLIVLQLTEGYRSTSSALYPEDN